MVFYPYRFDSWVHGHQDSSWHICFYNFCRLVCSNHPHNDNRNNQHILLSPVCLRKDEETKVKRQRNKGQKTKKQRSKNREPKVKGRRNKGQKTKKQRSKDGETKVKGRRNKGLRRRSKGREFGSWRDVKNWKKSKGIAVDPSDTQTWNFIEVKYI